MPASEQITADAEELCGKWMPRAQTTCGRKPLHNGDCRKAETLREHGKRLNDRRRGQIRSTTAEDRARWRRTTNLRRYNLTEALFDAILKAQGHACGMCNEPFTDGHAIFIDHDHACCPDKKSSCGECVRGLLCLGCNTALGQIERKYDMARAYLAGPPARMLLTPGLAA